MFINHNKKFIMKYDNKNKIFNESIKKIIIKSIFWKLFKNKYSNNK